MRRQSEMSGEEVLAVLEYEADFFRKFTKLSDYCDDPEPWRATGERLSDVRTAVAALVEREAAQKDRLRSLCQMLVSAVGADGPCDAEDAAARLIAERDAAIEESKRSFNMAEQAAREYVQHRRANEAERDALAARVAELEADAARYRWLRDEYDPSVHLEDLFYASGERFDALIDGELEVARAEAGHG